MDSEGKRFSAHPHFFLQQVSVQIFKDDVMLYPPPNVGTACCGRSEYDTRRFVKCQVLKAVVKDCSVDQTEIEQSTEVSNYCAASCRDKTIVSTIQKTNRGF